MRTHLGAISPTLMIRIAILILVQGFWERAVCVCVCSVMFNSLQPLQPVALQASLSMGFPRQESWEITLVSGLPLPSTRDLPDPGTKPMSLGSSTLSGKFFTTSKPRGKFILYF